MDGGAVINQAFSERYFAGERAVGRRVSMSAKGEGPWLEVIGVVNNLKVSHLRDEAQPEFYRDTRQFLFGEFATTLVALVVAAAGLYGVISYAVSRRRQEYGIRMALGATRGNVLMGVARQALLPVGLGLAAGLGGALALGRVLTSQLYGVEPNDAWTLAVVTAVMGAVAAGACAAPARQAARVDPMTALRSE